EDGIRDGHVTGVQTCALPIFLVQGLNTGWYVDAQDGQHPMESIVVKDLIAHVDSTYRTIATREGRAIEGHSMGGYGALHIGLKRSEERRVGKEWGGRRWGWGE